jgi:hypothetical protein
MAGIRLQHAMAGARNAVRERCKLLLFLEPGRCCMHRQPTITKSTTRGSSASAVSGFAQVAIPGQPPGRSQRTVTLNPGLLPFRPRVAR